MNVPKWIIVFLIGTLLFFLSCSPGEENNDQVEPNQTDGKLLRDLNGSENNNRTLRFEEGPIKVYLLILGNDGERQVEAWTDATDGLIQFDFVGSEPDQGIAIYSLSTIPGTCGVTFEPSQSDGIIKKATITIDPISLLPICQKTISHEIGHALGLFGHTNDGGLMDPDGGNGKFTNQVKRIITTLYTLPPDTDISTLE